MQLLIKNARIIAPHSPHHGQVKDILIEEGIIRQVGPSISAKTATLLAGENVHVSIGWMDVWAHFCDPGQEYKEDLLSGCAAAAAGGFTTVMVVPNTQPALQTKTQIEYVINKTADQLVEVLPIGAVSKNLEGMALAEMYEMKSSGAVAFSDGLRPIQSSGILLKALQYVKSFNGIVIQVPDDQSISRNGLMHEGLYSTRLGMPGRPAIAEEILVQRDIELAHYTDSHIHFTGISTQKSVALIKAAKTAGIKISCSVTPYHLALTDAALEQYDANLKVNPPLRTEADRQALLQAVQEGVIDCFASHHLPQDWDSKRVEFEYAKEGMIGLETAWAVLRTQLAAVPVELLVNMLTAQPRKLFGRPLPALQEGAMANLTIFDPEAMWTVAATAMRSKSDNSPFIGQVLKGKVLGVVNKKQFFLTHS